MHIQFCKYYNDIDKYLFKYFNFFSNIDDKILIFDRGIFNILYHIFLIVKKIK